MSNITVTPRRTEIGADISDIDLSQPLSAEDFAALTDAFNKHRVLVFRDQNLSADQQVAFSEHFGALEDFPDPKDRADGHKTVLRVTNVDRATDRIKPVDDPGHKSFTLGTSDWHIDSSFRTLPSKASMLYAIEMPDEGGDTMFADTTLAYDALPDARKQELADLMVIHDFEETRRRHNLPPRPPEVRAVTPPARQPLVAQRAHDRRALFIGAHTAGIEGMDDGPGRALLDELKKFVTQPQFTCRHAWAAGDMVMFDNICVMHKAMPYDLEGARRLLHRTTVVGEAPLEGVSAQ